MNKCPNCGRTTGFQISGIYVGIKYAELTFKCRCGVTTVTRLTIEQYFELGNEEEVYD